MTATNRPFFGLDSLWIQVAGLSCNLRRAHRFNSSGPGNRELASLSRIEVKTLLDEAASAGVRDVVFTGGEPFLHPEMAEIAGDTLSRFPATIVTAVRFGKEDTPEMLEEFERVMREWGIRKPRVKFLPAFRVGREE